MAVTAASTPAPRITWRAGANRIAHAHTPGAARTLCGELVLGERFAWPKFRDCMSCRAVAERDGAVL